MQSIIIDSQVKLVQFTQFIEDNFEDIDIVSFDLETNSVNERTAKTWGIGLAFEEDEGFYLPIRKPNGEQYFEDTAQVINLVNKLLLNKKVIGHNIIYDTIVWYWNTGTNITKHIFADTILMKHCINEERPFGLKEIAVQYLGPWADKAQQELLENIKANGGSITKTNMEMYKADTNILGVYCTWDVMLTFKLFNLFSKKLKEEGMETFFYEDEVMPLYKKVTIPMKLRGIHVDIKYFETLGEEISIEINNLEEKILEQLDVLIYDYQRELLNTIAPVKKTGTYPRQLAKVLNEELPTSLAKKELLKHKHLQTVKWLLEDIDGGLDEELLEQAQLHMFYEKNPDQNFIFNLNSKTHLKHLFFSILGEEPLSTTDKGEPQVDDDFLDSIKSRYTFVRDLQDLNKLSKIKGTYIEGILDRQINGVIYTSMLQFGTTSGRYSSTNPNLQNLPRPKEDDAGLSELVLKYNNAIRKGFVVQSGYKFIDADYSALEPRCFAHMSGSKDLQKIFHDGTDMYSAIAIRMFKLTDVSAIKKDANFLGKLYPEKRQQVKAFCLATVYGAEAFRIGELLDIPRDEAQNLIDAYLDAFPDLRKYIINCHHEVNKYGKVKTIFGRTRHLQRGKELYKSYGTTILDSRWAKKNGLHEERREYKNLLNNSTNFKIQGLAAHLINRACINITNEFEKNHIDGYLTLQIHDQAICTVKEDQAEIALKIVKDCMENVFKLDIPLVVEPAIAINLKDGH